MCIFNFIYLMNFLILVFILITCFFSFIKTIKGNFLQLSHPLFHYLNHEEGSEEKERDKRFCVSGLNKSKWRNRGK